MVILYADNQSLIAFLNNLKFFCETKYINIQFHWICKTISMKEPQITHIFIVEIAIDSLKKNLLALRFFKFYWIMSKLVRLGISE